MGACKHKQNLRFKITSERLNKKVRYDGLTKEQVTLVKSQKQLDQIEKELNYFWSKAPRKDNGIVDWDKINEDKLDYFEYITKQQEKLLKKISNIEDKGYNLDETMKLFMQINTYSVSY